MNLRKKIVTTAAVIALTASTALTGAAQVTDVTDTSSVTIDGGGFSVTFSADNFNNVEYSLVEQKALNGGITLNVNNSRGSGKEWKVTLTITDFLGQTDGTQVIPVEGLEVREGSVTVTPVKEGSQAYTDAMKPVYQEVAAGGEPQLTWYAPAGQGQGSYDLKMTADLIIPGRTIAQTYIATGTVSIVTAP